MFIMSFSAEAGAWKWSNLLLGTCIGHVMLSKRIIAFATVSSNYPGYVTDIFTLYTATIFQH